MSVTITEVMAREWARYLTTLSDGELWDQALSEDVPDEDRAMIVRELHCRHILRGEADRRR